MVRSVLERNNVEVSGLADGRPIVFAHGFGCDQTSFRRITPHFAGRYKLVTFDLMGCGRSRSEGIDCAAYDSLDGHVRDLVEICDELSLEEVLFVGHSVSAMIGVRAAVARPTLMRKLALIGGSPCYLSEPGYDGGMTREQMAAMLATLTRDYASFCEAVVPRALAEPPTTDLAQELIGTFKRADPQMASQFSEVAFRSDHRPLLRLVPVETLILHAARDPFVPKRGRALHAQADPARGAVRGARAWRSLSAPRRAPGGVHPARTLLRALSRFSSCAARG